MIRYKKNPRASKSIITVDGRQYQAKYIGKGSYSKVFRVGDRVIYYTRGDCGKEVLAQFQYDRMAHLPELIRHENITTVRGTWYVFSSPYYRNVTSRDKSAWNMMNLIINDFREMRIELAEQGFKDIDLMQGFVNHMSSMRFVPRSVVKALQEIVDVALNCGYGVGFDLKKNNFGVNEYGTLIFRDPIYVRN